MYTVFAINWFAVFLGILLGSATKNQNCLISAAVLYNTKNLNDFNPHKKIEFYGFFSFFSVRFLKKILQYRSAFM